MTQKRKIQFYPLLLMGLVLMLTNGCQKDAQTSLSLATITTVTVGNVTQTTASSGGTITSDGGGDILEKGVCWAVVPTPTVDYNKASSGTGSENFVSNITGLNPNTEYHLRAYAISRAGIAYGNEIIFTTTTTPPIVISTNSMTSIGQTSASGGGLITSDGGQSITARGICWNQTSNPTVADNKTVNGSGIGSFTSSMTGLTSSTTYYVRAYATSASGTAYGNEVTFTTNGATNTPTVSTLTTSNITTTSASCGGNVTSAGGGTVTARGICWSTNTNPTIANSKTVNGSGTGSFTGSMTGLTSSTTYYVRAYATNSLGTAYGSQLSFTTLTPASTLPTLTTNTSVTNITALSAVCGGNVSNEGSSSVIERGLCWSVSQSPTIANNRTIEGGGIGSFMTTMTGLTINTTYYVRAYATNSTGTSYGNQVNFVTSATAPIATIGDTFQGGIVFYVDATGQHGLIAAPSDAAMASWGCQGNSIIGTAVEILSGQSNTTRIISSCGTADIAARVCDNLTLNSRSDWYLPSKDELGLMYQNLHTQGLGGFVEQKYWSSSQVNAQSAWTQGFDSFGAAAAQSKDLTHHVRAVRSF